MLYKVSVEHVDVCPHPSADRLDIVAIGDHQYVVAKDTYKNGDKGIAVPKNSVLSHPIMLEEWGKYLKGPNSDRVGFVTLKEQESEGIVIPNEVLNKMGFDIDDFEIGVDISRVLGITKYVPEVPDNLKDSVESFNRDLKWDIKHDCKYPSVYLNRFKESQDVTITSKLHGSQINIIWVDGKKYISSKGLWDQGLVFKQDVDNIYTKAYTNSIGDKNWEYNYMSFKSILSQEYGKNVDDCVVQVIGEVIPYIKGFNYGLDNPVVYIYSVYVNGTYIDLNVLRRTTNLYFVPELYRGPFTLDLIDIANNFAQQDVCVLDGKTLNEGVVLSNGKHYIKVKNDKFMKKFGKYEGN
jgi:RNA ligase (TIGR02306 family)